MTTRRFDEMGHLVHNNLTRECGVVFGNRVDEWGRIVFDRGVELVVGRLGSIVRTTTRNTTGSTVGSIVRRSTKSTIGDGLNSKVSNTLPKKTEVG